MPHAAELWCTGWDAAEADAEADVEADAEAVLLMGWLCRAQGLSGLLGLSGLTELRGS